MIDIRENRRQLLQAPHLEVHVTENPYKKRYISSNKDIKPSQQVSNKIDNQRFEYNMVSRLLTMICTAQVSDSKVKISTNIWNELEVTDAKSYLNCKPVMTPVLSKLLQSASSKHLQETNTHYSSLNDYIIFFKTIHSTIGGMENIFAMSSLHACLVMVSLWDNRPPATDVEYLSLPQVGWKKYSVASDQALGMDSHLIKLMKRWGWYKNESTRENEIMSFLPQELYMQLNDTLAGICQICKKNKVQGACVLLLLRRIRKSQHLVYVDEWLAKEKLTIIEASNLETKAKESSIYEAVCSLFEDN